MAQWHSRIQRASEQAGSSSLGRRSFLGAIAGLACASLPSRAQSLFPSLQDQERFLLSGKVTRQRSAGMGITGTQRLTLELDSLVHDAHLQTIDEFKTTFQGTRGTEMNFRDTYKYNIAAYQLDRLLDMNMIPVSVKRRIAGHEAAVTWWVDDVLMTGLDQHKKKVEPPDKDRWNHQMHIARVFDQLIANTDRNLGNYVITKDWTVWLVDHTRAFRMTREIPEPKNLTQIDRHLFERLRAVSKDDFVKTLSPWMGKMEVDGVLTRRDLILRNFDQKIASQGESRVVYDYLTTRKTALGR
jgi:hypothetical protein